MIDLQPGLIERGAKLHEAPAEFEQVEAASVEVLADLDNLPT